MLSIEYIAGLFDGEGTVGVYKVTRSKSDNIHWSITLSIAASFLPILKEIQNFFQYSSIYSSKRNKKLIATRYGSLDTSLCKQGWRWEAKNRKDIRDFLSKILPYLHEKREQVQLVIDFIDGKIEGEAASLKCKELKKFNFTTTDNADQKIHKDFSGFNSACAKFSEDNIKEIRIKLKNGETQASIAKSYNTSRSVIWSIDHGLSYPDRTVSA